MGGLAVLIGLIFSLGIVASVYPEVWTQKLQVMLFGAILVAILGFLDDRYVLQPPVKLLGQICIAGVVVASGVSIGYIQNPLNGQLILLGAIGPWVTAAWLLLVMNTINLIDGLDGLAAGVSGIAAVTLFIISLMLHQLHAVYFLIAVAGASFGFLRYNFHPAKIFMGDTGSLLLGYCLAVASVEGVLKSSAVISLAIPFLTLLIPLLDTALAIIRRTSRGVHIFKADNEHIHHKLLMRGYSHQQAVLLIYYAALLLNAMAIILALTSGTMSLLVGAGIVYILVRAYGVFQKHVVIGTWEK